MKSRLTLLTIIIAITAFAAVSLAALSAYDIAKKSLEISKVPAKVTSYQMEVTNNRGKKKTYKFKVWEKQYADGAKKLVRFTDPADAGGTGLLTHEKKNTDDLQWLFLRSVNKARRLAAGDKDGEFMGSDLWYEDMGTQSADDFTHTLISQVMLNGRNCYLIESVIKPGINFSYSKTRSWVDAENFLGRKMEMYDKSGKHIKTMEIIKAEQMDGIWTMTEGMITTVGAGNAKTVLKILEADYHANIPDNYFTTEFLERF